jgi:tetratricopeptide (TPR) repeat protein
MSTQALGQYQKIDSLNTLLKTTNRERRLIVLRELVYAYLDTDYALALKTADQAYRLALEKGDSFMIVNTGRLKATSFRRLAKMDSSINLANQILPIAKRLNNAAEVKILLNGLGSAYTHMALYDRALACFFESLEVDGDDDEKNIPRDITLANIGFVHYKLKNYRHGLDYFLPALQLRKQKNGPGDIEQLRINIALCYAHLHNPVESKKYIADVESVCNEKCTRYTEMHLSYVKGVLAFYNVGYKESERHFLHSYALAKEIANPRFQFDNIVLLAELYLKINRVDLAEQYLRHAEKLISADTPYNLELIKVYSQLSQLYANSSDLRKLSHYQNLYIELRDSIYDEELTTNLMRIEAEHLERENKERIESQDKILALNQEIIFRQKVANISIGGVGLLTFILAVVLAKSNRRKTRFNAFLDKKVIERTRELQLNQEALRRALQERDVIMSKACKDINCSIASMKGLVTLATKEIDHPKAPEYWREIDNTAYRLSKIVNTIFHSLRTDSTA